MQWEVNLCVYECNKLLSTRLKSCSAKKVLEFYNHHVPKTTKQDSKNRERKRKKKLSISSIFTTRLGHPYMSQ